MTTTAIFAVPKQTTVEPIFTAPMLGMVGVMLSAMSSFYLLLSAIPALAASLGGPSAAGAATGVLMAATIAGEVVAPRIVASCGRKVALALALVVLAIACLAALPSSLALILVNCVARGMALGVLLVAACGISVQLAPPSRRAEAMSLYGVASAVPAILAVPLGPWVLIHLGPSGTALAAASLALAALAATVVLPANIRVGEQQDHSLPHWRAAASPALCLACGAVLVGAAVTVVSLAHPEASDSSIMFGLFLQGAGAAFTRWASARQIDRKGATAATLTGLASCAIAAVCLSIHAEAAMLAGMLLSGMAFGVLQSATLADLLARVGPSNADGAAALWNVAYDAGLGVGGLAVAALATSIGFSAAFAVTAVSFAFVTVLSVKRKNRISQC
ncbi:MFS transporter [Mesorhizobium sp. RCC_202]|uniref:MFS transporter n=1 Tax=Mesorhizobium sp. RCC_202 TaxID=3239222 RepID=UPI003523E66F